MPIATNNLSNTAQAAQNYNNVSGAKSIQNEVASGGLDITNQPLRSDSVTINSNQAQIGTNFQNSEEQLYSNINFQRRGDLQTLENRLNNLEPQINIPLQAESTETTEPTPEVEAPPPETSGSTETLESETNLESNPSIKTVIPIATSNTNGLNAPQVQVTTTGVYTKNSGVALQASLSAPFTVDQTV